MRTTRKSGIAVHGAETRELSMVLKEKTRALVPVQFSCYVKDNAHLNVGKSFIQV